MNRTHWEEIIERVERDLAESERQIALQRKIVDDLELLGQPTRLALRLLAALQRIADADARHRDLALRELGFR